MADLEEKLGEQAGEVMLEIYKDAAQPGVKQIGGSLGVAMEWIYTLTYPLQLRNERIRLTFQRNMENLRKSFASIPEDSLTEVAPELSVPVMEKLSYTSNEELAAMFINLLNRAANTDTAATAHPSFTSMIERLSVDEAKIVQYLGNRPQLLYTDIRTIVEPTGAYVEKAKYLTELILLNLSFKHNIESYVSNLIGMGILRDRKPDSIQPKETYDVIKKLHGSLFEEIVAEAKLENETYRVEWIHSLFDITPFGRLFIETCVSPLPEVELEFFL